MHARALTRPYTQPRPLTPGRVVRSTLRRFLRGLSWLVHRAHATERQLARRCVRELRGLGYAVRVGRVARVGRGRKRGSEPEYMI